MNDGFRLTNIFILYFYLFIYLFLIFFFFRVVVLRKLLCNCYHKFWSMLRLVTVCRPAKAFIFYSGHPDVCTAIIIAFIYTRLKKYSRADVVVLKQKCYQIR